MKVEDLNIKFDMGDEAVKAQKKLLKKIFMKEFGFFGSISIFLKVAKKAKQLEKEHPEAVARAEQMSVNAKKELLELSSLFLVLSDKLNSRDEAYNFIRYKLVVPLAGISMPEIYKLNQLKQCEGDIFDNFKKYNVEMFKGTTKDGTWKVEKFHETEDLLHFKVLNCANVELFREMGVPEMAYYGCHHDLAGYPLIEPEVNCEFRRPKTIADGDECCHFHFYRKGCAPDNAHLNK